MDIIFFSVLSLCLVIREVVLIKREWEFWEKDKKINK